MADEQKGHYVRDKDGTWTWVGSFAELLRYWYERGLEDGRKETQGGQSGRQ